MMKLIINVGEMKNRENEQNKNKKTNNKQTKKERDY